MKSLYILIVILPFLGCDSDQSTTENNQRVGAKNRVSQLNLSRRDSALAVWKAIKPTLETTYDSLTKKTTYKDPISAKLSNQSGLTCWFVIIQDSTLSSLYWDLQFADKSPLLIKSYKFLIDGSSITYTPKQIRNEYKTGLRRFFETSTNVAHKTSSPTLEQIASSKVTKVRFLGRFYQEDYIITAAEKKAIAKMIKAHTTYKTILGY